MSVGAEAPDLVVQGLSGGGDGAWCLSVMDEVASGKPSSMGRVNKVRDEYSRPGIAPCGWNAFGIPCLLGTPTRGDVSIQYTFPPVCHVSIAFVPGIGCLPAQPTAEAVKDGALESGGGRVSMKNCCGGCEEASSP
jgi:hypothetical protein